MLDVRALAKIDLHRHLEGSLRLETVHEVARTLGWPEGRLSIEALAPRAQVLAPMDDLMAVLGAFDLFQRTFVSTEIVERVAYEVVEYAARDAVRLLELRFSPDFLTRGAGLDWDAAMEALLRGVGRAAQAHDVAVGLIVIVSRGYGLASATRTVAFALRWRDAIVGFDLADDEVRFPSRLFAEIVRPIHDAGLPLTVHSGEACGPEHVWETLESLRPRRLGHGCAVALDDALIERVRADGVTIEACPTSNVRTRAVPAFAAHPARRLLDLGVPVALCSDDPGLFALTLSDEYAIARDRMGFDDDALKRSARCALDASFLPAQVKARLRHRHFAWMDG